MSDSKPAASTPFAPGFDFLQGLVKGASDAVPHLPQLSGWLAPTLSEEELDKRIAELKSVHFWLDQNTKALAATVQALEVQKLTLATLKSMNVSMGDMAKAFAFKPQEPAAPPAAPAAPKAPEPVVAEPPTPEPTPPAQPEAAKAAPAPSPTPLVDPLQMWSALTTQFQAIAAGAMKEVAKAAATEPAKAAAEPSVKKGAKASQTGVAKQGTAPAKPAPKKSATKPTAAPKPAGKVATKVAPAVAAKTSAKTSPKPAAKVAAKSRARRA